MQTHTDLPYRAGKTDFSNKMECHFQGSIVHGQSNFKTIYRSFNNLKKGSNLSIYVWLSELEKVIFIFADF